MVITCADKNRLEKILVPEKELSDNYFEKLKIALAYIKNNLTVDSLIDISNVITRSNNITLRKINVKPCGYDKICVDKFYVYGSIQ